ncbi:MAG: lycopene cyclase family protein [Prochlorococcus marinus CUG1439]|uniref:lycopene beta cyclase n=1 Tax=Prochlorococcus sp. MIT 1314 TaxID=3096220 RepID=UPI001B086C2B|nr:lycopene cyclase family protein [Prochlorococcus sp. MIT 1314]MCR8540420.1 lycopene cyclase family protein [Prochlorococcus marinus CUG1439]
MEVLDILILGSGPAALCLASELAKQDLYIKGISKTSPYEKWKNTYGIWASELEELGLESLLSHRWCKTVSFFGNGKNKKGNIPTKHNYDYGLINREAFQNELLNKCKGIDWLKETAKDIREKNKLSEVICFSGLKIKARLVIDASGHKSNFVKRPVQSEIAQQAAYGIVGKFSSPPVNKEQFVLMDFRPNHLNKEEQLYSPSFLYAMDLGNETFFVEETSLASYPALSQENLKKRLLKRLNSKGIKVNEIFHEENCLFPMNLPLPFKKQFVLGFGGAASMVHPASGYMVGSLLRRAPLLAEKLAIFLKEPDLSSLELATKGWDVLWPYELTQRHKLYQYGLQRLMSFDESRLRSFFSNFFRLSTKEWVGFLTNTLPLPKLIYVMSKMFINSPLKVKLGMLNLN